MGFTQVYTAYQVQIRVFVWFTIHSFIHSFIQFINGSTALCWALGLFFTFVFSFTQTVGLLGRVIEPVARPFPTCRTETQNKCTQIQTAILWMGFELTIPEFERTKTVRALDRAATVIGRFTINFFHLALQPQFGPWPTSMNLSVSLRFSRS
jgi:hypothetical protein